MKKLVLTATFAALALSSQAQVVWTQWNFNSTTPDGVLTTGTTAPNVGAGTASLVGATTATFAGGGTTGVAPGSGSDPAFGGGDNSAWNTTNYAAQGTGSGTRGVQFLVSTVGTGPVSSIVFDRRTSGTSSRFVQVQYTLDGVNFTSAGLAGDGIFEGTGTDQWVNGNTVDMSSISGTGNNANFGFRIVAVFAPSTTAYAPANPTGTYGTTGTLRYDMVTVNVVPEPATMLALGAGLAAFAAARRRRK